MIGWEIAFKVGEGFDLISDTRAKNILMNNEVGYALRNFYKDRITFFSSSNPLPENITKKEDFNNFFLPDSSGHFEPKICRKIDINSAEEIIQNFKKETWVSHKRFEIVKENISFSKFYFELKNSSGAEVSLKNYSINGLFVLKRDSFIVNLPFLSNQDLSISFLDYFSNLEPYLHLPLPQVEIKPSRFPCLLFPYTLSFIFEKFIDYFLTGEIPEMVEGFVLKDVPFHQKSPNYFPVDGEGSIKSEFQIRKGSVPLDSFSGFLNGKKSTSNSLRNSIYSIPQVGFHNIVLEGPERDLNDIDSYLALTFPLRMEEFPPYFILEAEGFLYKKGKISSFFPSVFAKFTLDDFFNSFYFTIKPLLFYSFTHSIGVPFLFLKGLSIYPVL